MNHYRYEELSVGMEERFLATITEDMTAAFHRLSGDPNPLHTDEAFARAHGFQGRVVYGMLTASLLSTLGGIPPWRAVPDSERRDEVFAPGVRGGYARRSRRGDRAA